jgi:two-component system nitrogen regulation response regulator NtrX
MAGTVLVVDDEKNIRRTLRMVLEGDHLEVRDVERAEEALQVLTDEPIDLVITDIRLPGMSGIELLERIRKMASWTSIPVVVISGHATVGVAVDAIKLGATDFFEKPLDRDRVLVSVRNALRASRLEREVVALRSAAGAREEMVGESAVMRRLYSEVEKVAPTRGRVLITGESGTGKELIARAIHRMSPRHAGPFVKVNCAAIPAELVESELFGHEKGAFTGAVSRKRGHFEARTGGRSSSTRSATCPWPRRPRCCASWRLARSVASGATRCSPWTCGCWRRRTETSSARPARGAFARTSTSVSTWSPVRSPALREHPEDIPMLVGSFLREFCRENGMKPKPIVPAVLDALVAAAFPATCASSRTSSSGW